VVANEGSNTVSVLAGNGDGTFASAGIYTMGRKPLSVAVGAIDRDGQPDIVTANFDDGTVSVLLNETFPVLKSAGPATSSPWPGRQARPGLCSKPKVILR
jgi:DNA-binding beta-propeller fold protein YncE